MRVLKGLISDLNEVWLLLALIWALSTLYWKVEASEKKLGQLESEQGALQRRACRIERGLNRLLVDAELRPEPIPEGEDVCQ